MTSPPFFQNMSAESRHRCPAETAAHDQFVTVNFANRCCESTGLSKIEAHACMGCRNITSNKQTAAPYARQVRRSAFIQLLRYCLTSLFSTIWAASWSVLNIKSKHASSRLAAVALTPAVLVWGSRLFHTDSLQNEMRSLQWKRATQRVCSCKSFRTVLYFGGGPRKIALHGGPRKQALTTWPFFVNAVEAE